jgi:Rhs element Vgr protein
MKSVTSYTLRVDGEEFPSNYKVKSIVTLNEANRIPRSKLILLDGDVSIQDFELSNQKFFKPGVRIEIDLGYEGDTATVFKGIVVRHGIKVRQSGESVLEIECKHEALKLTVLRKSRFFYDSSDRDALAAIIQDAAISHAISGMDEVKHLQLVQYDSSSWDFLMSRAEANGCIVTFENEKLNIAQPSMQGTEVITCRYGENVLAFDARIDSEDQFAAVEGKSWSPADQEILESEETSPFINETGNLTSKQLSEALGNSSYQLTSSESVPEAELIAWAKSRAIKKALSKVIGTIRVRGNASVNPGKTVMLAGLGDRFNGKAFVTGVRHEMSDGNWTTDIQFGLQDNLYAQRPDFSTLPASGMLPAIPGIHTGIVTGLEGDPDGEFRIKVKLPVVVDDEEGIWARVAKGYAGNNYGIHFFPEIGDEVIIGFLNDDPRKAIVLGSLFSSANPSPESIKDNNYIKSITTKSNLSMIWDDEKKSVKIATPAGNRIEIDEDAGKITITDKNRNLIEMSDSGITIELKISAKKNIDIGGLDITQKAKGKFTAEGSAGAELKTSAIAVLKGSLVQIN